MDLHPNIPIDRWKPLSVNDVTILFNNAPFLWCLAGGYAVEQFLGRSIRSHSDIDIVIFRSEQLKVQHWLQGWQLFAADKQCRSGTLRRWHQDEYLPEGIHDIWGHQSGSEAWQMQIMVQEEDGETWYCRRNHAIGGLRSDLMCEYGQVPCLRIEIQLMYKAKNYRKKDELDFRACLGQLRPEEKAWLKSNLGLMFPHGHEWIALLEEKGF